MASLAQRWGVLVEETLETPSSLVGFGTRDNLPVVLKVVRREGDEWRCGEVLEAFRGQGVVRAYEYTDGAVLLERLNPGTSLVHMAVNGQDEQATEALAHVIQQMSPSAAPPGHFVSVEDWGKGFQRYRETGDRHISPDLVEEAEQLYLKLCASQRDRRLLHGDLHHHNILFDGDRGWIAIDPKGVVGELEYELGASLRNPIENPELFDTPEKVERRLRQYERTLKLNYDRALAWGFAQAVLSAIWGIEDGLAFHEGDASLVLANAIRPLLKL